MPNRKDETPLPHICSPGRAPGFDTCEVGVALAAVRLPAVIGPWAGEGLLFVSRIRTIWTVAPSITAVHSAAATTAPASLFRRWRGGIGGAIGRGCVRY